MVKTVKVQEAKTNLSSLLASVERGDEVVIARGSTPIARLVPLEPRRRRELGFVPFHVPDTFFEDLPVGELEAWEA
jgi:prevent-host-death family protein